MKIDYIMSFPIGNNPSGKRNEVKDPPLRSRPIYYVFWTIPGNLSL